MQNACERSSRPARTRCRQRKRPMEALRESLARNEAFKGDTAKLDRMADSPPQAAVAEQAQRLQEALKDVEQRLNAAGAAKRLETLHPVQCMTTQGS